MLFIACKNDRNPTPQDNPDVKTIDSNVYIAGSTIAENGYVAATYWKNGVPVVTSKSVTSQALAIAVQDTDVYTAGYYWGNATTVAVYWKNGIPVEIAIQPGRTQANAIAVKGSEVYVAGSTHNSGAWGSEATFWAKGNTIKLQDQSVGSEAFGIAIKANDIYIAGQITLPSEKYAFHAVYWKNGIPVILPHADALWSSATAIAIHNNDVYVVGYATSHSGAKNVARCWKNGVMTTLADTLQNSQALGIAFKGNDFYITGYTETSRDVSAPIIWKNGIAQTLNYPFPNKMYSAALGVAFKGNDMYVIGSYLGGVGYVAAYWKNDVFTQLKGNGDRGAFASAIIVK